MQANTKESMKRTKIIASTVTPGPKAVPEKHSAERILDAASELLSTEGYAAFSMRKVAAKVGLSQAAIYRHYKDKSELVGRIVDNGYALLRRSIEERSDPTGSPSTLIAEGFKAYVTFACEHSSLFKFVLLQDIGPSQVKVNVLSPGIAGQRRTFELLAGIISRGTAEGSFEACDPETTAQAVWAAMFGLAARIVLEAATSEAGKKTRNLVMERHIEIILRGLRGEKELA
jgi:AcrR family transcriptional regulator